MSWEEEGSNDQSIMAMRLRGCEGAVHDEEDGIDMSARTINVNCRATAKEGEAEEATRSAMKRRRV